MNVFLLQLMDGEAISHLLDQCNQELDTRGFRAWVTMMGVRLVTANLCNQPHVFLRRKRGFSVDW